MADKDKTGSGPPGEGIRRLFSQDGIDYLLVRELRDGPLGDELYLCLPRMGEAYGALAEVAVLGPHASWKSHQRLQEVGRLGALLSNPAIPRIRGPLQHQGMRFLVTEYVPGFSMNMACNDACLRRRPLSEDFALHVVSEVAGALTYVHGLQDAEGKDLGIIHRSISLYTVIVRHDGQVMLTEFMSALSRLPEREVTTASRLRGDLDFAAPERLCPDEETPVDGRSDLFSLGLLLLELTTGEHLYHAEVVERASVRLPSEAFGDDEVGDLARRATAFQPEHVEELTRNLSEPVRLILHKLLRRHPAERYPSATALKADLDACRGARATSYGAREALAELLEARADAKKTGLGHRASDEAERLAGEPPPSTGLW
jgi:serine/threonine-protein kinase